MQQRAFLITLLLVALAVVDLLSLAFASISPGPDLPSILFYALIFGQFSMLTIWCLLGSASSFIRFLSGIAGLATTPLVLDRLHANGWLWLVLLSMQMAILGVPLPIVRLAAGIRLDDINRPSSTQGGENSEQSAQPVQFSLWHLMLAVTVIGVLMGIVRAAGFYAGRGFDSRMLWEVPMIAGAFAVTGLAAAWFGLGQGPLLARLAAFVLITGLTAASLWFLFAGGDSILGMIVAIQGVVLAISLYVLRATGLRLVRGPRFRIAPAPLPAAVPGPFDETMS
ncbi:MAG: hypothetical protein AB7O62_13075 [Pirellulales bacterium]